MATAAELMVKVGLLGVDEMGKGLKKAEENLRRAGMEMTKAFTIPISGMAAAAFASSEVAQRAFSLFAARTKSAFGDLGTSIARAINLDDLLTSFANGLRGIVDWFTQLDTTTQKWVVGITALVAGIGPLMLGISRLIGVVTALRMAWLSFNAVFLATPAGWAALAIAGIAVAGAALASFLSAQKEANQEAERSGQIVQQPRRRSWEESLALAQGSPNVPTKQVEWQGPLQPPKPRWQEEGTKEWEALRQAAIKAGESFQNLDFRMNVLHQDVDVGTERLKIYEGWLGEMFKAAGETVTQGKEWGRITSEMEKLRGPLFQNTEQFKVFAEANRKYAETIREINDRVKLFGEDFDVAGEKVKALKDLLMTYRTIPGLLDSTLGKGKISEYNQAIAKTGEWNEAWKEFKRTLTSIPPLAKQIGSMMSEVVGSAIQGVGDAFARVIVYGEKMGDVFAELGQRILATIISTLIQIGIQRLLAALLGATASQTETSSIVGGKAAQVYATQFQATHALVAKTPIVGPFIAPAAAAGAAAAASALMIAGTLGAGLAGKGAGVIAALPLAEGGIFTRPTFMVGEAGPEALIPLRKLDTMLRPGGRGGEIHVHVEVEGREIGRAAARWMPSTLVAQGI